MKVLMMFHRNAAEFDAVPAEIDPYAITAVAGPINRVDGRYVQARYEIVIEGAGAYWIVASDGDIAGIKACINETRDRGARQQKGPYR